MRNFSHVGKKPVYKRGVLKLLGVYGTKRDEDSSDVCHGSVEHECQLCALKRRGHVLLCRHCTW